MQLACSAEEWNALCSKGQGSPFVHERAAWDACVAKRDGVLAALSDEAIKEISRTIKFSRGGLAHFTYEKASRELAPVEVSKLFELFGISPTLAKDYEHHYCEKRGTCSMKTNSICTSNC